MAALTGLVIAALTLFDQNLRKQIRKDDSLDTINSAIQSKVYLYAKVFFILSLLSIAIDVAILYYAPQLATFLQQKHLLLSCQIALTNIAIILIFLLNASPFLSLIPLINLILNPDSRNKLKDRLTEEVVKELNEIDNETDNTTNTPVETTAQPEVPTENQGTPPESTDDPDRISIAPRYPNLEDSEKNEIVGSKLMMYYRKFEKVVRSFFPVPATGERNEPLSMLIRRLYDDKVFSKKIFNELRSITKLRNLYMHGGDIGEIDPKVIIRLDEITKTLRDKRAYFRKKFRTLNEEQHYSNWIDKNVSDFEDAANLDQAVRYGIPFGEYKVVKFNDESIVIAPTGDKILLYDETEVKLFLDILEEKFTRIRGYSLEEQANFDQDLKKLLDEDKDDDIDDKDDDV